MWCTEEMNKSVYEILGVIKNNIAFHISWKKRNKISYLNIIWKLIHIGWNIMLKKDNIHKILTT